MFEAVRWPDDVKPSRSPIRFIDELEVEAPSDGIWSLLAKSAPDAFGLRHEKFLRNLAAVAAADH